LAAEFAGVTAQLLLQPERCVQAALRMILVSDRRPEQGEDAVAGRLNDITAVTMYGFDHQLERWVDNGARLFGVEILHQLHGALDIGEQRGDCLALTLGDRRWIVWFCS